MEIKGSGKRTKQDNLRAFLDSFPYQLSIILCVAVPYTLLILSLSVYFNGFEGALSKDSLFLLAGGIIVIFTAVPYIFFTMNQQRDKLFLDANRRAVLNSSGIEMVFVKRNLRIKNVVKWSSVKRISLEGDYLYIYTKSKLYLTIPVRFFDSPNLLETIQDIRQEGEQ